jgi:hypothetical protein
LYGGETWTVWKVDQKYLESFEMRCWRRIEKISWTDRVRIEVLYRVKEERNILHTIKRRKANWIGHILRRNCILKRIIEDGIEVMGRQGKGISSYCMTLSKRGRAGKLKRIVCERFRYVLITNMAKVCSCQGSAK